MKPERCLTKQSFVAVLRACGRKKDVHAGSRMHADALKRGLVKRSSSVARGLVSMYAQCGAIGKALDLLDGFPVRDVVAWNTIITGYALQGQAQKALHCFEHMQLEGLSPDKVTFASVLKVCANLRALEKGEQIHDEIAWRGLLRNDVLLSTALVNMYAKCGALAKARHVLKNLPSRDVVCWNALIAGYVEHGQDQEALSCFEQMQLEGLSPSVATFMCILKACGSAGAADEGKQIHDKIVRQGLLETNIVLGSALVDMYTKLGALAKAQELLEEFPVLNVVLWNALIAKCTQLDKGEDALKCFEQMQQKGIFPDDVTFICILKACGSIGDIDNGELIHNEITRLGFLGKNVVLGNALVDMYAKCGALAKAYKVLKELPVRDVVSWSALIAAHAHQGQGQDALSCFKEMQNEGISPNIVTFVCILKACGSIGAAKEGEQIHNEIVRQGLFESDIVLGNALVDMYAKCGAFAKAQQVLEELPLHDVISWNTLISGYTQQGQGQDALDCFECMQGKGLSPDEVTFTCILKACGTIGAADRGEQIHDEIAKQGLLENNVVLGNALVDMYVKCGALAKAQQVFEELPARNVISWSTLITGYAHQGQVQEAVECFARMQHEGFTPNMITFSCVLNACSHSGLVDEGQMWFANMITEYGIKPVLEHLTCMVDLLGRAGHFDKVVEVIKRMPLSDYPAVWSALLSACQKWGDVNVGRWAFEHAIQLDERYATPYIWMSKIYTAAGMAEDAESIKAMRLQNKAWKKPGCRWGINSSENFYSFLREDIKRARNECLHSNIENFSCKMSQRGQCQVLQCVS